MDGYRNGYTLWQSSRCLNLVPTFWRCKPLTLVAYQSRLFVGVTAYIEPIAIGDPLREMPLYVSREGYVSVPLQETYDRAFAAMPRRWASVLEQ